MNIYVINGPNINLLGTREPEIYGRETLGGIAIDCKEKASKDGHIVKFMQSNSSSSFQTPQIAVVLSPRFRFS